MRVAARETSDKGHCLVSKRTIGRSIRASGVGEIDELQGIEEGVIVHRNYVVVNAECIIQEVPELVRFAPTRTEPLFDGGIKFYSGADRLNARAGNQSRIVDRIIFPKSVHALFFANNGTLRVKAAIAVVQLKQGLDFCGDVWNACLPSSIDKILTRVASIEQLERRGYDGEALTAYRTSDDIWYVIGMSFSYTETIWHAQRIVPEYIKHTTLNWFNQSTGNCKFITEATRGEVRCDDDVAEQRCTAIVNECLKDAREPTATPARIQPQPLFRRW